jgi:multimeric flavodoxin WrbA
MKILALNGSVRKYGNSEILLKQALMAAEAEGAEVEILKSGLVGAVVSVFSKTTSAR